jgi:hypothetical protein
VEDKKLSNQTQIEFKKFLDDLNNKVDAVYDHAEKKYKNYKTCKINDINELLYNNRHKIMDDIVKIIQEWNEGAKIET